MVSDAETAERDHGGGQRVRPVPPPENLDVTMHRDAGDHGDGGVGGALDGGEGGDGGDDGGGDNDEWKNSDDPPSAQNIAPAGVNGPPAVLDHGQTAAGASASAFPPPNHYQYQYQHSQQYVVDPSSMSPWLLAPTGGPPLSYHQPPQPPPPLPPGHPGLLHFYEAQMRDHAAAYANAAAAAAMTAAQIAASIASWPPSHFGPAAGVPVPPAGPSAASVIPPGPYPPPCPPFFPPAHLVPPQPPTPSSSLPGNQMMYHPTQAAAWGVPMQYQHPPQQVHGDPSGYNDMEGNHRGEDYDDDDDKEDDEGNDPFAGEVGEHHRIRKRQQLVSSSSNGSSNNYYTADYAGSRVQNSGPFHQYRHQEPNYFSQDEEVANRRTPWPNRSAGGPALNGGAGGSRSAHHYQPPPRGMNPAANNGGPSCGGCNSGNPPSERRGRRRPRFWNDTGSSYSDPALHFRSTNGGHNNHNSNDSNNNRRRNRKMAMVASSSSDGGSASWTTKKKARQPNDESLVGKTGISALFEWCHKRRTTPTFGTQVHGGASGTTAAAADRASDQPPRDGELEDGRRPRACIEMFEVTVCIDGIEMGKGRAVTKVLAKHQASRQALQLLLPGVAFDEDSGILTTLPGPGTGRKPEPRSASGPTTLGGGGPQQPHRPAPKGASATSTASSLEELAPNLAKQLAIGHTNDDEGEDDDEDDVAGAERRERNAVIRNAARDVQRGVTVDDSSRKRQKIPQVYPGTSTTSDDEDEDTYYASRGASVCSSLLHVMVQIDDRLPEAPQYSYKIEAGAASNDGGASPQLKRKAGAPVGTPISPILPGSFQCAGTLKLRLHDVESFASGQSGSSHQQDDENFLFLEAVAVAGSKRAARHSVAAKLLAILFPECDGMAQVKEAAEAARDEYAASRAQKQQTRREKEFTQFNSYLSGSHHDGEAPNFCFAVASEYTPPLPAVVDEGIAATIIRPSRGETADLVQSKNKDSAFDLGTEEESELIRQLSRQRQLDERINATLQKSNEHDDVGRSLPEQVTADDVGRTVLRQATADDAHWIDKLFCSKSPHDLSNGRSPMSILGAEKELSSTAFRLWSSSTIILLLCRAIAPYEDPPLGCAILTLGFSMQRGRLIRISQIASKPHLPRERFIECLHSFSTAMSCSLETASAIESSRTSLRKDCMYKILNSHLLHANRYPEEYQRKATPSRPMEETLLKSSLQSVQEVDEGVDESDSSSREKRKGEDKPCKRSRVE